ncbi:MAG: hypothetical protein ISS15_18980 [Alphaproteobacteria bacterium]|nr:hypothetical protein [Alphaproteobacteria bacterium]MBL7099746.1 hypothetical protein [Alphaproteobacteria bacterium]
MPISKRLAAAIASLVVLVPLAASAKEITPPPGNLARAHLAATMAEYGMANHDAATLLAAAHIINGLKANVVKMSGSQDHRTGKPVATYDPLELLKLAKIYAASSDASLLTAINAEMRNVRSTQATCSYQDYCTQDAPPYCWQEYYCY